MNPVSAFLNRLLLITRKFFISEEEGKNIVSFAYLCKRCVWKKERKKGRKKGRREGKKKNEPKMQERLVLCEGWGCTQVALQYAKSWTPEARVINMYHAINRDLWSFVCQLKKTLLNIVWCLPPGTENALRKEISIAALHMVWHDWLDQRRWMAAGCSWGARSPTTISVPEDAAQGIGGETLQGDFEGTKFVFFFSNKMMVMEFSSNGLLIWRALNH